MEDFIIVVLTITAIILFIAGCSWIVMTALALFGYNFTLFQSLIVWMAGCLVFGGLSFKSKG